MRNLESKSIQSCVTSPPYYNLRDYGIKGQIGLENTPDEYIENLVSVFREVKRVLRDDGTLWVNISDSYAANRTYQVHDKKGARGHTFSKGSKVPPGCKPKDMIGIPWMLAFALRKDGWYLRQDIIWEKPNPMPESVKDRCTRSHEYIFFLSKSRHYYFDSEAMQERNTDWNGTRNKRDVWTVATMPYKETHFATFPEGLVKPCILSGSHEGDTVLDPFNGAATTGVVCKKLGRSYIGIELNPEYVELSNKRLKEVDSSESNQFDLFLDYSEKILKQKG